MITYTKKGVKKGHTNDVLESGILAWSDNGMEINMLILSSRGT